MNMLIRCEMKAKDVLEKSKGRRRLTKESFFLFFFYLESWWRNKKVKAIMCVRERERALETYLDAVTTDNATYEN